ncbi:hypothetical protein OG216_37350 [Streptomycetaceae bacterium NBC_01309]
MGQRISTSRLSNSELNRLSFQLLRKARTLDQVREVFQAGLDEATGRRVNLVIDESADVYEVRARAIETLVLVREFRGATDLGEVLVLDAAHFNGAPDAPAAASVAANGRAPTGDMLTFNLTYQNADAARRYLENARSVTPSSSPYHSMGLTAVTLHEFGHLLAEEAARIDPSFRATMASDTVNAATPDVLASAKWITGYKYDAAEKAIKTGTDPEVIRNERLNGLQKGFYGNGHMNELSRAVARYSVSPYAASSGPEQEGETITKVGIFGADADPVSREINNRIMHIHGLPPDRRLNDLVTYAEAMAEANAQDRQRDANERSHATDRQATKQHVVEQGASKSPGAPGPQVASVNRPHQAAPDVSPGHSAPTAAAAAGLNPLGTPTPHGQTPWTVASTPAVQPPALDMTAAPGLEPKGPADGPGH